MGWTDNHMHEFQAGDVRYGTADRDSDWDADDIMSEKRTRLHQVLQRPKDRLTYWHDFGTTGCTTSPSKRSCRESRA